MDRNIAFSEVISDLESQYGKGIVMQLGDCYCHQVDAYPTGFLTLDIAIGIGGIPKGRIIEIYGPEASGKSTLAMHMVAEVQKQKGYAAYIDVENAFDLQYALEVGIDPDRIFFSQPDNAEQSLSIARVMAESGVIDLIVIDSVAALVPKEEIEGTYVPGAQARLMGRALRTLAPILSKKGCTLIFINQVREAIGSTYAEITPGGKALKYYSSLRLDVRKEDDSILQGETQIGNHVKIRVAKNKVAPPFKQTRLEMIYGKGFSKYGDILDAAIKSNIVEDRVTCFCYDGIKLGRNRDSAIAYLESHPKVCREIEATVRETYHLSTYEE